MKRIRVPVRDSRPITMEKSFDVPLMWQETQDGTPIGSFWWGGTVSGMAEISHEPDGPTWVSDLWVSASRPAARGEETKLIRIDPNDRELFTMIADSVVFSLQDDINEWIDRELHVMEAA